MGVRRKVPSAPATPTPEARAPTETTTSASSWGPEGPFQKATKMKKRMKLFLWGNTGTGKTTTALQFPKPVVIDMEGSADLYGKAFAFSVFRCTEADDAEAAVDWLANNPHEYETLIIDPVTIYWDALQKKWNEIFMRQNVGSKGFKNEYYDFQVRDWMTIKAEFKEFLRKLIGLDMNVVVTARAKTKYKEGSFMVAAGDTFDGEKSLPYTFDTVVFLFINKDGTRMAWAEKDRTNKLPQGEFQLSYQAFARCLGDAKPARLPKGKE